jgi:DNA repair exonuclease SbcCD ATPase subunit
LINKIDETTSNQQEQILKIKLTLETIQLQIKNEFDLLMKQITEAENILNDPNSTIEQLQRSAEILAISRPKLEEIDRLYKDLDADNETSQELRKKTADKLFKLNELFRHNQKAADDRIEMIIQREHDQLSAVLNEGQQILNELPDSSENLGDFNQRHENAVKSAQNLLQQLPSQNSHAEEFSHLLDLATNMKRDIDDQVEKWNQLNKLCKEIADKQLKVEKAVNAEQEKGVQKLDDAQKTVKAFKVSF